MKILTLCSNPYISLVPVTQLLEAAGLPRGLNSLGKNQSYAQWHEQVFDAYEQDGSGLLMTQPLNPGRVWQDMAGHLIQANLSNKQWYWTDSRAGWLLDFWNELEPQHRFVLIYSPPQIGISQCLLQADEQHANIEIAIKSWVNYHFELLRFYRRNQDKCILVNFQRCLANPGEFIQICKQLFELDINEQLDFQVESPLIQSSGIEEVLFHLIIKQYPEINNLFQELEASATPFAQQIDAQPIATISGKEQLADVCRDYRHLRARLADDATVKKEFQHELDLQLLKTQKLESEKAEEITALKTSLKESKYAEVVLEIQATQEKSALESLLKKSEDAKVAIEQQSEYALQSMLKNSGQIRDVLENQIQSLQDEVKQFELQVIESKQENELIVLQLQQVQEESEVLFLKAQKIESEKAQEISSLKASIKKSENAQEALEKQTQTLSDEVKQSKLQNTEADQENELMLLQLHQVQEELETLFLKKQRLESENTQEKVLLEACKKESETAKAAIEKQKTQEVNSLQATLKKSEETRVAIEKQKSQEITTLKASIKKSENAQEELEKQTQTLSDEVKQSKQQNTEADQENELMLLQLHQVQEELETLFLKKQRLESENTQEIALLEACKKESETAKAAIEKQKTQEVNSLQATLKKSEETRVAIEKQKSQEITTLKASIKKSENAQEILNKQTQTLNNEVKQSKQQSTEFEQENELMLLQLHQVQEELEHYFIKYQELESNTQSKGIIAFIDQQQDTTLPIHAQLIQVKQSNSCLEIDLVNLQWQEQIWPKYHLQIISPDMINDQIVTSAAIKLPVQANNLLPLKTWPPQTADEQGAYWMIDQSLLSIEQMDSHLFPEDIAFLHALVHQLPEWLKFLEGTKNNNYRWDDYYQTIQELKPSLEAVFKLQE